ncbi:xylosyltransferase oxt-like [Palaemon carinicauda]|uniref:xylosyltransferase oxt-like n=1 Tax=Palaemon carinicauda TaxID=392227 RepID=UPI0035B5B339
MAIVPARAIVIVSFNIFRVVCRKYGIYLLLGMVMILLQGFSGYYVLRLGGVSDSSTHGSKSSLDQYLPKKDGDVNEIFHQASDRADADTHDKGPPVVEEIESLETIQEHFGVKVPCLLRSKEAVSAIKRATTSLCRMIIANVSCQIQAGSFYPTRLQSYCPSNGRVRGKSMGCFVDSREKRILRGHAAQLKRNTPNICADICYQRGYVYAGVQYGKECFCGNEELPMKMKVSDVLCAMPCTGDVNIFCGDYLHMNIYETGLANNVVKTADFHLRNIAFLKKYLDEHSIKKLVIKSVITWIDYCNSIYYRLTKVQLNKLQNIINRGARLIKDISLQEIITLTRIDLPWLPIKARIEVRICAITHQVIRTGRLKYLR